MSHLLGTEACGHDGLEAICRTQRVTVLLAVTTVMVLVLAILVAVVTIHLLVGL